MLAIRRAAVEDLAAIARVHAQADWEAYSRLFGDKAQRLEVAVLQERWRTALSDVALVAESDGVPVGVAHARRDRIEALYVLSARQRQRVGTARRARVLEILAARGVSEAQFDVVASNLRAVAFYRARGARLVGRCVNTDPRGASEDLVFAIATTPGS